MYCFALHEIESINDDFYRYTFNRLKLWQCFQEPMEYLNHAPNAWFSVHLFLLCRRFTQAHCGVYTICVLLHTKKLYKSISHRLMNEWLYACSRVRQYGERHSHRRMRPPMNLWNWEKKVYLHTIDRWRRLFWIHVRTNERMKTVFSLAVSPCKAEQKELASVPSIVHIERDDTCVKREYVRTQNRRKNRQEWIEKQKSSDTKFILLVCMHLENERAQVHMDNSLKEII